jgi:DNA-binding NtrC family response regulator
MAQGGTVYFDQVSELSPHLQAKLLRVVEEKRFERVGGNRTVAVDVRFVASTNQNLKEAVARGAFRPDLFHRLSVFHAELPPLRDRAEEIPLLASEFLERERSRLPAPAAREFSPEALAALASYSWPGNVRELKAAVLRALLAAPGPRIERTDLPEELLASPAVAFGGVSGRRPTLSELERNYVELTLRHARGNTTLAARILGISRKALWEKRRRYRLD